MAKKYNHITIPKQLVNESGDHANTRRGRNIQNIPKLENVSAHKEHLSEGVNRLNGFQEEKLKKTGEIVEQVDMKIRFRGLANVGFLDRYHAKVYQRYDDRPDEQEYANDVVVAKISTIRPEGRTTSDYEHFQREFDTYLKTGKLESYFDYVEDIAPLTLDEITEPELYKAISEDETNKQLVDVVFGSGHLTSDDELRTFNSLYSDDIVVAVDSVDMHYFRVEASKSSLEDMTEVFSGIVSVERAPLVVFSSGESKEVDEYDIDDNTDTNAKPILLIDSAINGEHPILKIAALAQQGDSSGRKDHGTMVGSLIACGPHISAKRQFAVENKVLPINAFITTPHGVTINEPLIEEALKDSYSKTRATIANFSINGYLWPMYSRRKVDKMSILFDEWARKYNAVFTIATGNLFQENHWPPEVEQELFSLGYPNYFMREETCILPPSDSINNIAVGSVVYGATPDSMADSKDPSPITRRGFLNAKHNYSIKPDVVQYDSNFDVQFNGEENGPYMAAEDGNLVRAAGTSFAAPLSSFALGMLAKKYPLYNANTLKALLLHFAEDLGTSKKVTNNDILHALVGNGMPDLDKALYSLSNSTSLVIEDSIQINHKKKISIPIPASLAGSSRLRLRVKTTLVYNPPVNSVDIAMYNPIVIAAKLVRSDGQDMSNFTTTKSKDGAHRKSNVKIYDEVTKSTVEHMGEMWSLEVIAEPCSKYMTDDITQDYSVIVTIEDMEQSDDIDIHQEINQMINVEVENSIDVTVEAS